MSIHQGWTEGPVSTELGIFASDDVGKPPAITLVMAQLPTEAMLARFKSLMNAFAQRAFDEFKKTPVLPGDRWALEFIDKWTIEFTVDDTDNSDEPLVVSES